MGLNTVEFFVARATDRDAVDKLARVFTEASYKWDQAEFTPLIGGSNIAVKPDQLSQDSSLSEFLAYDTTLIQTFKFTFATDGSITLHRQKDDPWFDRVQISAGREGKVQRFAKLVVCAKKCLGEVIPKKALTDFLAEDAKSHYAAREHTLAKQEDMLSDFFRRMEEYSLKLTEHYQRKQAELEQQNTERRNALENDFKTREQSLQDKVAQLEKVRSEIDDRESRHVRRKIREELKKVLQERGTKFELTQGTRGLRKTVFWFTIALLLVFGGAASALIYRDLSSASGTDPWLIARQITFTLAFGITAVFFIRWNHQWFQRHADEEFKLKRLDLDIDRASWLVEMVMEWKDEKGIEIPEELLDRLSRNLFVEEGPCEENLHPADILASTIFGAAANVKLKLPNGTEVAFDRKSIRRLGRGSVEATE